MTEFAQIETDLDTGLAHHTAGRFYEAEAVCRRILAQEPDNPDALNLLGAVLQEQGDLTGSITVLSRAVKADPDFAEAFTNLARAQSAAGDPAAAKESSARAVDLDPQLGQAHLQFARAALSLGDHAAAAAAAARAVTLMHDLPDAHLFLGHALTELKDFAAAAAAYRSAAALDPNRPAAAFNLGIVLTELGETDQALAWCQRAVALAPDDPDAHAALGRALVRIRDIPGSLQAVGRALELAPDRLALWRQQGDNHALLGQFDAASACYHRILAANDDVGGALVALATIGKLTDRDAARATLGSIAEDASRADRDRVVAGFALGKLFDEAGDYAAAFRAFDAANRRARAVPEFAGERFDPVQFRRQVDHLSAAFMPASLAEMNDLGDPSDVPVFIVGMPRSGTSLVEQILASHPRVFGAGELKEMVELANRLEAERRGASPLAWDKATIRHEAAAYLNRLREVGGSRDRIINKLPDNILLAGHIAVLFPNARIIFCRRDPRDVCLSCFFQLFGDGIGWSLDLADCAARVQELERLTNHWRSVLGARMLEVDYEILVNDLERQSRRLVDFLGLTWDDACLSFHATERVVRTASLLQVRQPLYDSSVGRWRNYRPFIQPLLDGLIGLVPADETEPALILTVADAHAQAGRIAGAEAAYRLLIDREPGNPDAVRGLVGVLLHDGRIEDAASLLSAAVPNQPADGASWTAVARAYRMAGNLEASADAAARAVALDPSDAAAHYLLGSARLDLGDADAAQGALERAVALDTHAADAWHYLGMARMRQIDFHSAAEALAEAVRLSPDDPEYLTKLGWVLREINAPEEALPHLRRALELKPDDPRIHQALVMALWRGRHVAAAEEACAKALLVAPGDAELWLHAGYCHAARGRFAKAAEHYAHALALDPNLEEARLGLSGVAGPSGDLPDDLMDVERLADVLHNTEIEARKRIAAGFALAKVQDRAGAFDAAFEAIVAANALVRTTNQMTGFTFDPVAFDQRINATIALFTPANLRAAAGRGDPSDRPVFVVGMPRSGTTLVEQIVSSHPEVFGAGELADIPDIVERLDGGLFNRPPAAWNRAFVTSEAVAYLAKLAELGGGAKRVVDKMPDNFRFLGHIAVLFPNARIIVCRRDPRDVCFSCYAQPFGQNLSWTTDLAEIGVRARAFDRLMAYWRIVLPLPMLEVQYEELVRDLEGGSRRLIEFLGLRWDPACLSFHQTERAILTASQWQVRQPVYTSSVGRWRHYRKHLGPLLDSLEGLVPVDEDEDRV